MDADTNVRNMATDHMACLTKLRNSHLQRGKQEISACNTEEKKKEARALTELFSYVEGSVEEGVLCFKLSGLRCLYQT